MDDATLQAWWWRRQALDGSAKGKAAGAVLAETGWARSVAGAGPYLTLFARSGAGRAAVDDAVARLEIHELPSARGCTYVVPAQDFVLALRAGLPFSGGEMSVARKLGVTDKEVEKLCQAVVAALERGPLEPSELTEATAGAVRNLGPEGKKKGLTSTLPLALGKLQAEGEIRRLPLDGRLDQQRYRYVVWKPNPLRECKMSDEAVFVELARRYFRWIGPATLAEFQWFSGLGVKAAKAAVEPLGLAQIDERSQRLAFPEDRDAIRSFQAPRTPQYALVSSLDALFLLRRDLKGLVAEADWRRAVAVAAGTGEIGGVKDLPSHAIVDRGRLAGLWEYDPDSESIAWMAFGKADKALKEAVARTEEYVRADLGDARAFSLDTPKTRAPRIEAIRGKKYLSGIGLQRSAIGG